MGFLKKLKKRVGKVAKSAVNVTKDVATAGLANKSIRRGLGKAAGVTAGMMTLGLVKPEIFGLKSKGAQSAYRVGRGISLGAGLVGAGLLAGGAGAAGGGAGKLAGLAGKAGLGGLSKLAGGGLGGGGLLPGLAGVYGAYQGAVGQDKALSDVTRYEQGAGGLIRRQEELAGLDPVVAAQMKHQAQQDLRAGQAERGIFESGVAAKQEAELMPQIDQQQRAWQLQQLAAISPQYTPLMASGLQRAGMFGTGEGMGEAIGGLLGGGGGEGGGSSLFDLAGSAFTKGKDWLSNLWGGSDQGYDLSDVTLAGQGFGGTYY